jgi:hypothetical protein
MDTPLPGQAFQVGSNWSSQQRKVAEVVGERFEAGQRVVTVRDDYGQLQELRENKNATPQTDWWSK